jgi:hypothetical protein
MAMSLSFFTALLFVAANCAPLEVDELGNSCSNDVVIDMQGILKKTDCGGCDTRCWLTTDDPEDASEIVHDPADPDFNAILTNYNDGVDGIVLDGAIPGPDADGDGLADVIDPNPADANGDADGDGYPDSWEIVNGTDPNVADPPPPADEIYVVLPEGGPAITRTLPPSVGITVRSADIYFLVDTSNSMDGELLTLKNRMSTFVVPEILALIADAQFGVGHFRDYNRYTSSGGYGVPYENRQIITDVIADVQSGINSLALGPASDYPESDVAALHATVTGDAIGCGPGVATCPPGRFGHACFRSTAQPIIILFTDDSFHNGVADTLDPDGEHDSSCYEYSSGGCDSECIPATPPCPSLETVVGEITAVGAKVIGIWSGAFPGDTGQVNTWGWGRSYPNFDEVIDIYYTVEQTGSIDGSGNPYLYGISSTGSGLDIEVVNAVDNLVGSLIFDVTPTVVDPDPTAPDTTTVVNDVEPTWCEDCSSIDTVTNTIYDVQPGTGVTFDVILQNDFGDIPIQPTTQEVDVIIRLMSDTGINVGERTIHVLVPGTGSLIPAPTTGQYWFDFAKADTCDALQTVHWERLYVDMDTSEPGTNITFAVQTSNDSDFPGPPPSVPVPLDANDEGDIQSALLGAGQSVNLNYLRVVATLTAGIPGDTPYLHSMTVRRYCVD